MVHATPETLADGTATGFLFEEPRAETLLDAVRQALQLYRDDPRAWRKLATTGMHQDFSWEASARGYVRLYAEAIAEQAIAQGTDEASDQANAALA